MIPFYIESENGHDTEEVKKEEVKQEIEKHLENGKWVTIEKSNGTNEVLTNKEDIPVGLLDDFEDDNTKKSQNLTESASDTKNWREQFNINNATPRTITNNLKIPTHTPPPPRLTSVTVTNKMKGG